MSLKRKHISSTAEADSAKKKAKGNFFTPKPSTVIASSASAAKFVFDRKQEGTTRLSVWNVNGVKSVDEKILKKYLEAEDPDILIFTETKCAKGKPDIMCLKTRYKYQTWGIDPKPGQAGTAVLCKQKPLNIVVGLPKWDGDSEETAGRYVQLEFEHSYVVGTYVPNSGEGLKNIVLKQRWNAAFKEHVKTLDVTKPVIWAGDFNCIPSKQDIDSKASSFWDSLSGLSRIERAEFDEILHPEGREAFVDAWRHLHPKEQQFTHSSTKYGAWRLDSFILSERILDKVKVCEIRHELKDLKLSDHWPVTMDLAGPV